MESNILIGVTVVVTILICFWHFKRSNYATLAMNVLIVGGLVYLFGRTLGGLIIAAVASGLVSVIFLIWSPLKGLDNEFKDN